MFKKISFIIMFILLFCSNVFAYDNYLMFNYGNGNDSIVRKQQKEEQIMYGIEYGQRLLKYEKLWLSVEAAYSTHKYTKVDDSFLIKLWGIYKSDSWNKINIYSGIGVGLSTYRDNDLVKGNMPSSLGVKAGLEYMITENVSMNVEYALEHNSGIWKRDSGRNIDLVKLGVKYYF